MTQKNLGLLELIAIAIGAMVGGGIFTILGISVAILKSLAPFAIGAGGLLALFGAYSYIKLGVYYKDEGATYAFFKRTFPNSKLAASFVGWFTIFGYISTLALYAYTFASYATSGYFENEIYKKIIAIVVLWIFVFVNIWSVKGMGKIEDILVYLKMAILLIISFVLIYFAKVDFGNFAKTIQYDFANSSILQILTVSSITFVAYEGFQLVVNAVNEMDNPEKNIPRAIYISVAIVALIYFIISLGAVLAIDYNELIKNKEYALANGAKEIMGTLGESLVVFGALLATSSAISSTLFGSSRQLARIAQDGYMPKFLTKHKQTIPINAIIIMALLATALVVSGGLRVILEFGSITFLLVSLLMAYANYKIRHKTSSNAMFAIISIIALFCSAVLILYYEYKTEFEQLIFILAIYAALSLGAYIFSKVNHVK